MGIKTRSLEKYQNCKGNKCSSKNTVLVKMVYEDVLFIPLCKKCLSTHRRNLNAYKNKKFLLKDSEITEIYFDTLNMS